MKDQLETILVEFLKLSHRSRQRERDNVLHSLNLVPRDIELLEILFEHHPDTVTFKDIIFELDAGSNKPTNRSTISQAFTRLMKEHGLVQKILDIDGDQRQPIIKLTESGVTLAKALSNVDNTLIPKFIDAMNMDDNTKGLMASILKRGISNFKRLSTVVNLDFDEQKPNVARVYDYIIGGKHNFAIDRAIADSILNKDPTMRLSAIASRAFLRRSIHFLAEKKGIRQFIDIGSGLPTVGNTHEIVQDIDPKAKVLYVDIEKDAVDVSNILLKRNPNALALCADLSNPDEILNSQEIKMFDFNSPVAIVMVLVLQFLPRDEEALASLKAFRDRISPGSHIVIAHPTKPPEMDTTILDEAQKQYTKAVKEVKLRSRMEVEKFFDGAKMIHPGLVYTPQWNPKIHDPYFSDEASLLDSEPYRSLVLAGVGEF